MDRATSTPPMAMRPVRMLDEEDDVGADVYPWPRSPMSMLAEADGRGLLVPLSQTLFSRLVEENVLAFMSGRNGVGAAWSAYRMVTYEHDHGAQTCPFSAIT
jgi:hypothetical protein